jgi:beta-xylosidase
VGVRRESKRLGARCSLDGTLYLYLRFLLSIADNSKDNGKFMMYYAATHATVVNGKRTSGRHCIGHAISNTPEGPFTPMSDEPLYCPLDQGGAIDPNHFRDVDGTHYVSYKIDGNAMGHGGSCGNAVPPLMPTPIMLQQVAPDGFTPIGPPTTILDRGDGDGPLVEAPSLMRRTDGTYYLFYSSNCYDNTKYDVNFATAKNVRGPYTKTDRPLLITGDNGLISPGGADVSRDGKKILFHGNANGGRTMYVGDLGDFIGSTFKLAYS